MQSKGRSKTDRHGNDIITEQLDPTADLLPSQATQDAVAICGQGIKELKGGADGEDVGDDGDDGFVRGEEVGDVVLETGEDEDVEAADDGRTDEANLGGGASRRGESGADEVGNARGGGDGEWEWDLEGDGCQGGNDRLGGEDSDAEVACAEGEDLESETFGFDHEKPGEGELDHGQPVLEDSVGETVPALTAVDEIDVKKETDPEEVIGNRYCYRRAYKSHLKFLW